MATSRARLENRAMSHAMVAPVIQSATTIVTATPKVSNPVVGLLPAFYRAFHDLYPDVALPPRFPWEATSTKG